VCSRDLDTIRQSEIMFDTFGVARNAKNHKGCVQDEAFLDSRTSPDFNPDAKYRVVQKFVDLLNSHQTRLNLG
jgi:hypothetical protein